MLKGRVSPVSGSLGSVLWLLISVVIVAFHEFCEIAGLHQPVEAELHPRLGGAAPEKIAVKRSAQRDLPAFDAAAFGEPCAKLLRTVGGQLLDLGPAARRHCGVVVAIDCEGKVVCGPRGGALRR